MNKLLPTFLFLVFVTWASTSNTQDNWTADQKQIIAANNGYIEAILAADLDLLMTFYTADATLMPPLASPVKGKVAVRVYWSEGLNQVTVNKAVSELDEILVFGNWAYSRGRYTGISRPVDGGPEYEDRLSFSGMWHRESDGSWKIARDMWNNSASGE